MKMIALMAVFTIGLPQLGPYGDTLRPLVAEDNLDAHNRDSVPEGASQPLPAGLHPDL